MTTKKAHLAQDHEGRHGKQIGNMHHTITMKDCAKEERIYLLETLLGKKFPKILYSRERHHR